MPIRTFSFIFYIQAVLFPFQVHDLFIWNCQKKSHENNESILKHKSHDHLLKVVSNKTLLSPTHSDSAKDSHSILLNIRHQNRQNSFSIALLLFLYPSLHGLFFSINGKTVFWHTKFLSGSRSCPEMNLLFNLHLSTHRDFSLVRNAFNFLREAQTTF